LKVAIMVAPKLLVSVGAMMMILGFAGVALWRNGVMAYRRRNQPAALAA
jgi:hypothetical protein